MKTEFMGNFSNSFLRSDENNYFLGIGRPIPWSRDSFAEITNFDDTFYLPFSVTGAGLTFATEVSSLFSRFSYLLGDDSSFPPPTDIEKNRLDYCRGNIFVKKIKEENFSFLIPKYTWTKGEVYDAYDDTEDLFNPRKRFFVYNKFDNGIYKCLDNNGGSQSTVEPEETYTESSFVLEDGYKWKLLYKISNTDQVRFSLDSDNDDFESYIPIKPIDYNYDLSDTEQIQYDIQQSAVQGSIESVRINPTYKNNITFNNKCVVDENVSCSIFNDATAGSYVVDIVPCEDLIKHPYESTDPTDYLQGLVFNVVSGPGAGQRRLISTSRLVKSTSGQVTTSVFLRLNLEDPLDFGLSAFSESAVGSVFTIEPQIKVIGDGKVLTGDNNIGNSHLISADFRPTFKAPEGDTTKTLDSIEIVNMGEDYTNVRAEFVSGITHYYPNIEGEEKTNKINNFNLNKKTFLRPILPPLGGHGNNPLKELGCDKVLFRVELESNEQGKLPATNDFRQIALIKNPILNDPIVQFRFVETGTSGLTTGNTVSYNDNYGTITRVFNFTNSAGNEIFVSSISGSFDGATFVNIVEESVTFNIDPFDGFKKYEKAGSENRNILVLEIESSETGTYVPRDIVVGIGSSENGVYPSFASGMIREVTTVGGGGEGAEQRHVFRLEGVKGTFAIGEKIGVAKKPLDEGLTTFHILNDSKVLTYRYSQDNYRDSYSLTTKITLEASPSKKFNAITFFEDQPVYSFDSDSYSQQQLNQKVVGTGHIFRWGVSEDGTTAALDLVGVKKGLFRVGDYLPYAYLSDRSQVLYSQITSVQDSDVKYDSGEIVHIQNFKPIKRTESSKEEISLVLGL
jgi:hypothetical protein